MFDVIVLSFEVLVAIFVRGIGLDDISSVRPVLEVVSGSPEGLEVDSSGVEAMVVAIEGSVADSVVLFWLDLEMLDISGISGILEGVWDTTESDDVRDPPKLSPRVFVVTPEGPSATLGVSGPVPLDTAGIIVILTSGGPGRVTGTVGPYVPVATCVCPFDSTVLPVSTAGVGPSVGSERVMLIFGFIPCIDVVLRPVRLVEEGGSSPESPGSGGLVDSSDGRRLGTCPVFNCVILGSVLEGGAVGTEAGAPLKGPAGAVGPDAPVATGRSYGVLLFLPAASGVVTPDSWAGIVDDVVGYDTSGFSVGINVGVGG